MSTWGKEKISRAWAGASCLGFRAFFRPPWFSPCLSPPQCCCLPSCQLPVLWGGAGNSSGSRSVGVLGSSSRVSGALGRCPAHSSMNYLRRFGRAEGGRDWNEVFCAPVVFAPEANAPRPTLFAVLCLLQKQFQMWRAYWFGLEVHIVWCLRFL